MFWIYRIWLDGVPESDYVGSTGHIWDRLREHLKRLGQGRHGNARLQKLWDEAAATPRVFRFEILGTADTRQEAEQEEARWVLALGTRTNRLLPTRGIPVEVAVAGASPELQRRARKLKGAERYREAVRLVTEEHYSIEEAAATLECSSATIMNALKAAAGKRVPKSKNWETYGQNWLRTQASSEQLGDK